MGTAAAKLPATMTGQSSQPRKVLLTGGGGFVGQWVARALLGRGDRVWLAGQGSFPTERQVLTDAERQAATWISADVRRDADMAALVNTTRPDLIIHLAGISFVPEAEGDPAMTYDVNVVGAVRLLAATAAARDRGEIDPLVIVVGSGTQYGVHDATEMPLAETAEQRPANVYAATKVAQEAAALFMGRSRGVRVIGTRSFSHSGVGHDPRFLLPALVQRAAGRGAAGGDLAIGNDVVRDYLHIGDVVAAYLAIADRGRPGAVYNVASGIGVTVGDLARGVLRRAGGRGEVVSDPALQRQADMPVLIGSPALLERDTGWRRRKTYEDILDDLFAAL